MDWSSNISERKLLVADDSSPIINMRGAQVVSFRIAAASARMCALLEKDDDDDDDNDLCTPMLSEGGYDRPVTLRDTSNYIISYY